MAPLAALDSCLRCSGSIANACFGPLPLLLIAAPYLLLGLLWALYCRQFPGDWAIQFSANSTGRGNDIRAPWRGVWREINGRFRAHFWPEGGNAAKLKIVGLLLYLSGTCTLTTARTLRQRSGCRLLLCLTLVQFLCLSLLASTKNTYYIIYILPYFAAAAGVAISYLWTTYGSRVRLLCAAALAAYVAIQVASVLNLALVTGGYRKEYRPAVQYLKATLRPDDLVMGAAELGYALGFYNLNFATTYGWVTGQAGGRR